MSEGPKITMGVVVQSAWEWLPSYKYDDESNFVFIQFCWLFFSLECAWRKS